MPLRDRNIEWLRRHVFRNAQDCATIAGAGVGVGTGTPSILELSTFGITAFKLDADLESVCDVIQLPFDMDPSFSFKIRLHYTSESTTAADTFTWTTLYNNAKRAAAVAFPATALDTTYVAANNVLSGTAFQIGVTGWGVIAADKWTRAEVEAGHIVSFDHAITTSAATLTSEYCYFVGWEYSYVQQQTRGSGSVRDLDAA